MSFLLCPTGKSAGGVPAFVRDYWAEERKSAQFDAEMEKNREEMR